MKVFLLVLLLADGTRHEYGVAVPSADLCRSLMRANAAAAQTLAEQGLFTPFVAAACLERS